MALNAEVCWLLILVRKVRCCWKLSLGDGCEGYCQGWCWSTYTTFGLRQRGAVKWDQGIKTWDRLETCNCWSHISYVQRSLHQYTGAKAGVIYFVSLVVDIFLSAFSIELFGNLNKTSNLATTMASSWSWTSCPNSGPLVSLYQICKDAEIEYHWNFKHNLVFFIK